MMSEAAGKICNACGQDCSDSARIKDPRGRYYHKSCYEAAREKTAKTLPVATIGTPDEVLGPDDLLEPQQGFNVEAIMGELDRGRTCPQCGSRLEAAAVLCVQCGFNTRERAPLPPPAVQRAPRGRTSSGAVWPIVIGVTSLIYAALSLLLAFVDVDLGAGSSAAENTIMHKLISAAFALWLGLAAIGVLLRTQTGAVWMLRWAVVQIVLALVCGGLGIVALGIAGDEAARRSGLDPGLLLGTFIASLVVGLIWPVVLTIWLRRSSVQKQIGQWR